MSVVLAALRRLPLWVWPLLVLALYAGYLHRQVEHARRAAFNAKDAASAAAVEQLRALDARLDARARAVEGRVADLDRRGAAVAAQTKRIEADLGAARTAGQRLEATGTMDEVAAFGRSLGYHPLPMRRP